MYRPDVLCNLDIYVLYKILGLFLRRCRLYILMQLFIPLFLFPFITKSENWIMISLFHWRKRSRLVECSSHGFSVMLANPLSLHCSSPDLFRGGCGLCFFNYIQQMVLGASCPPDSMPGVKNGVNSPAPCPFSLSVPSMQPSTHRETRVLHWVWQLVEMGVGLAHWFFFSHIPTLCSVAL